MCTRISVFVPTATNLDALEAWSKDCGVALARVAGVEGQWRDTSILVTRSYCDCWTPVGWLAKSASAPDPESEIRALRKRGWSEAKIARSLAQKKVAEERNSAQFQASALVGLTSWVTFFKGAPTHGHLKSIGVFYREDGRYLSTKDFEDCRREASTLASLEPSVLAHLGEGVLHEFVVRT